MRIMLIWALLVCAGGVQADNLQVESVTMMAGETKTVSVELYNIEHDYIMLDFYLKLPDGVSVARNEDQLLMATPNTRRLGAHSFSIKETSNNCYHVLIYSMENEAIEGSSGELFTLALIASESISVGQYEGLFYEQVFSDPDMNEVNPDEAMFNITIAGDNVFPGDANSDETVSIADAVAIVDYILTNGSPTGDFDSTAADVDGNGTITISDAMAIVNIIIGN